MDLSNNDIEEYVEKLENWFSNQSYQRRYCNELSRLIENVSIELNVSKRSENVLCDNFKKILESDNIDVNQKYVRLQEAFCKQDQENKSLKNKLEEVINQSKFDLETQKLEYLNKIRDMEDKSSLEIANLKNQLESGKICHEAKEMELYNDLQLTKAAIAYEWNEKELNLNKQFEQAKNSLRISQNKIRSMQCEINHLRAQMSLMKVPPKNDTIYLQENPIKEIKNKLADKQYQQYVNSSQFYGVACAEKNDNTNVERSGSCLSWATDTTVNIADNNSNATEVGQSDSTLPTTTVLGNPKDESTDSDSNLLHTKPELNIPEIDPIYAPVVHRGKSRYKTKCNLPPLRQCSDSLLVNKNDGKPKKRKLYDPNNLDYLNDQ